VGVISEAPTYSGDFLLGRIRSLPSLASSVSGCSHNGSLCPSICERCIQTMLATFSLWRLQEAALSSSWRLLTSWDPCPCVWSCGRPSAWSLLLPTSRSHSTRVDKLQACLRPLGVSFQDVGALPTNDTADDGRCRRDACLLRV
jgi:hypothetical protein